MRSVSHAHALTDRVPAAVASAQAALALRCFGAHGARCAVHVAAPLAPPMREALAHGPLGVLGAVGLLVWEKRREKKKNGLCSEIKSTVKRLNEALRKRTQKVLT